MNEAEFRSVWFRMGQSKYFRSSPVIDKIFSPLSEKSNAKKILKFPKSPSQICKFFGKNVRLDLYKKAKYLHL